MQMQLNLVPFGYDPLRLPCLERLVNFQGLDSYFEVDSNNNIEIAISAYGNSPCPNITLPYEQYEKYSLGHLPIGVYHIQMIWVSPSTPFPVPDTVNFIPVGEEIEFEVLAIQPVPFISFYTLIILGVLLCILTLFVLRKRQT